MKAYSKFPILVTILVQFAFSETIAQCSFSFDTIPSFKEGVHYQTTVLADSAVYHFTEAKECYKENNDWQGVTVSLCNIASCHLLKYNIPAAKKNIFEALCFVDTTNTYDPAVSLVLYNLGKFYRYNEKTDSAFYYAKKSFDIRKKNQCSHDDLASSYYLLGVLENRTGNFNLAIKYMKKSIAHTLKAEKVDSLFLAESYSDLAKFHYFSSSNTMKSIENGKKSIDILSRQLGKDNPALGYFYQNYGLYHNTKGDSRMASDFYEQAKTLNELGGNIRHPNHAGLLNSLGCVYFDRRDIDMAKLNFDKSIRLYDEIYETPSPHKIVPLVNCALVLATEHKFKDAEEYLEEALSVCKNDAYLKYKAAIHTTYGHLYIQKGQAPEAIESFFKAQKIILDGYGKKSIDSGKSYADIGMAYFHLNNFLLSRKNLFKGQDILLNQGILNGEYVITANKFLAKSYLEEENYPMALEYTNRAINLVVKEDCRVDKDEIPDINHVEHPYFLFQLLAVKGEYYISRFNKYGDFEDLKLALSNLELNQRLTHLLRTTYRTENSKLNLAEEASSCFKMAVPVAYKLYEETKEQKYLVSAFSFSESDKARVLLDAVTDVNAKKFVGIPDSLVEVDRQLKIDLSYLREKVHYEKQKAKSNQDQEKLNELENLIFDLEMKYENLLAELKINYPKYFELKHDNSIISINEVQNSLAEDQSMLEYFLADSSVFVFYFERNKFFVKNIPNQFEIQKKVDSLRTSIQKRKYTSFMHQSYALYHQLILPFRKQIEGRRLVIIPDGPLNLIPFGLFVDEPREGTIENYYLVSFLIEKFPFCYNYSAKLHAKSKEHVKQKTKYAFLGFAPEFNNEAFSLSRSVSDIEDPNIIYFKSLPWAIKEVETIKKNFTGNSAVGEMATEARFKKMAYDYSILHLATHAVSKDQHSLYSGLAFLADTVGAEEDGFLHTHELYNLPLKAQLAALSACNTGLGKYQKGEGIMSMARGFAFGGCPNIIVSKWELADRSTAEVMEYFYAHIKEGKTKDVALQLAKIDYVNSSHFKHISPVFWAGLTIIGNADAISFYEPFYAKWPFFSKESADNS